MYNTIELQLDAKNLAKLSNNNLVENEIGTSDFLFKLFLCSFSMNFYSFT